MNKGLADSPSVEGIRIPTALLLVLAFLLIALGIGMFIHQQSPKDSSPEAPHQMENSNGTPQKFIPEVESKKSARTIDFANNIIAPLIVALIIWVVGYLWGKRSKERDIQKGVDRYLNNLETLINTAVTEGETKAIENAQAILSSRNTLKKCAANLMKSLNSDFDTLELEIKSWNERITLVEEKGDYANMKDVYRTIERLKATWDAKKIALRTDIHLLLAEFDALKKQ